MESGNSDPEMYITHSSPQRKRTFPTLEVLCEDTLAPDEDIWALAGDINEVEEQPKCNWFRSLCGASIRDRSSSKDR